VHTAVAAVIALVVIRLIRIVIDIANGDGFSFPLAYVLLAQIAISLSILGAYAANRRRARTL
jgi:hypothetical protein